MHDILSGPNHSLLHNLIKDIQYWTDRHSRMAKLSDQALEDLPGLLKKAYADMFPHNTPWVVFHFVSMCRVVFESIKDDLHVSSLI